jgi:rRNA maturation endonuclease Nob1
MGGMQGMMQEMQGMMGEMMGVHAYNPAALLERKADLGLTGDQERKLEALASEVKTAKDHAKLEHATRHARIVEQFKLAKPDPSKVKVDGQEAMQDMAAAHGVSLSAAARAKALLTDAQRTKVDGWVAEHMKKDGGHSAH